MSKIEWTHRPGTKSEVWNMIRGCSLESKGCEHCYAMHFAHRFSQKGGPFEGLTKNSNSGVKWTGEIRLMPEMLTIPLKWRTPRTCFVNSMTDLWHPDVSFEFIDQVFAVMVSCHQHTFQILTKRAERMAEYFSVGKKALVQRWEDATYKLGLTDKNDDPDAAACWIFNSCEQQWPRPNIWVGVSAEDQKTFDDRVSYLMKCDVAVKIVSIEPQIGPINMLSRFESNDYTKSWWVLNGGESGNKARPAHPDWFRMIRNQCKYMGIPYFFKQKGAWEAVDIHRLDQPMSKVGFFNEQGKFEHVKSAKFLPLHIGHLPSDKRVPMTMVGKHKSGNHLDGVQHIEFPA